MSIHGTANLDFELDQGATLDDERESTLEERVDTLCYARCLRLVLHVSFLRAGP